jgi:hypothetical protein
MDTAADAVRGIVASVAPLADRSNWAAVLRPLLVVECAAVLLVTVLVIVARRRFLLKRVPPPFGAATDDESGRITLAKRFLLLSNVAAIVAVLIIIKLAVHALHLEFFVLDTLFSSVVASDIFIIGFLLTSMLPDYKEAERIPADIRTALEAIYDDVSCFAQQAVQADVSNLREILTGIVSALDAGLGRVGGHTHVEYAIAQVDRLGPYIAGLEQLGMTPNFIVRLRGELDILRRSMYRVHYIQKIEFVPSVEVLIRTLVLAVLIMLLCLKTDGSYGTAFVFGFICYLFVYSMHLISVFQKPYRQGSRSVDKVDLFLLRDFVRKIQG